MRLIDADNLFDFLTDQFEKETGAYSKGRNAGIRIARSALHDKTITPTIILPPNPPLTLEELQEMDGEPVWVADLLIPNCSCYRFTQKIDGHFLLMEPRYYPAEDVMIPHYCADDENQGYGQTWLAYRRKPEEGTK